MATKPITIRSVETLGLGGQLWDAGSGAVKGFGVRRQRRDPTYVVKYRFRGRQRFFTIGRHGVWTPVTARVEAKHVLGLVAQGIDPAASREAARAQPTFAAFVERYLTEHAAPRKKPRSVEEDRRNLRLHILPALGRRRIGDVTRADIARLHSDRASHPANANRCLALLSHLFAVAAKWGVLPDDARNPARGIAKFPERRRERFLSASELARLGNALVRAEKDCTDEGTRTRRTAEDWRAIACYRLLLFTGARLSEVLTLQWGQIDWDRGIARLPDSKTGAKNLHLPSPALSVLAALPRFENNPFVLPGDKLGMHFIGVQKPWQRVRAVAGLPDLRIHDLRHAFASLAVAHDEALYLVGAVLGHRNVLTTARYAHLSDDPVKEVAHRTAERIAAMLSGTEAPVVKLRARGG